MMRKSWSTIDLTTHLYLAIITDSEKYTFTLKVYIFQPSFTSSLNITETSYFYENSITIFLYGFSRYSSTDGFLSWLPTRIYIKRINKNNKKINLSMRASRKNLPYYIWVWDPLHLTLFHFSHWSNGLLHGIFFPQTKLRQWCYTIFLT